MPAHGPISLPQRSWVEGVASSSGTRLLQLPVLRPPAYWAGLPPGYSSTLTSNSGEAAIVNTAAISPLSGNLGQALRGR